MDDDKAKRFNLLTLAKRLEELPLLKTCTSQKMEENHQWINEETTSMAKLGETKKRLARMVDDRDCFLRLLKEQRHQVYVENAKAFDRAIVAEKELRLEERKARRKEAREHVWQQEKATEAKRKEQEEKRQVKKHSIMIKDQKEKNKLTKHCKKGKSKCSKLLRVKK